RFCERSATDRAESAQALFGRHRDQPCGVAETRTNVSRGVAWFRQAPGHRGDGVFGFDETLAPSHAIDLACEAQRRDDCRRVAVRTGLAAEAGVHLRRAASPYL